MKKGIIIALVLAAIVALIVAIPSIKENRLYHQAMDGDEYVCDEYIYKYPDGKHLDDVMYRKTVCVDYPLTAINDYIQKFPAGKHVDEVNAIYENLWDEEIAKYNSRDKVKESEEAVRYMLEMLNYMKEHHVNAIQVSVNSTLKLKDYDEYDKSIQQLMEILYEDEVLPLKAENIVSLKSNFQQGDVSNLEKILVDGVQESMDNMFTPGFIIVKSSNEYDDQQIECPELAFNYTIESQEDSEFPHFWIYTEESYGRDIPKKYLIGITIRFNADFSIPNSNVSYSYSEKGTPEDDISGIDDISDGYRRMTQICFAQFSNKMSKNMGLKETYFQGE